MPTIEYTTKEAAALVGWSPDSLSTYALNRGFPKWGGRYLFTPEDIEHLRIYLQKLFATRYKRKTHA